MLKIMISKSPGESSHQLKLLGWSKFGITFLFAATGPFKSIDLYLIFSQGGLEQQKLQENNVDTLDSWAKNIQRRSTIRNPNTLNLMKETTSL